MSPFKPSQDGFPFPNYWHAGTPVIEVSTPLGTIPIGDASGGVCGGMVFAAADYFLAGLPVPQTPEPPLFKYLCRRLLDSWQLPFGVLKYYDWQRRSTASRVLAGVKLFDGTAFLTATVEWPKVQARLDAGAVAPLGLVKATGFDPRRMGQHHQVLAYMYELQDSNVIIDIYDPNHPGDDGATLAFTLNDPDAEQFVTHSRDGPTIRGFFLTDYEPSEPVL
jgi:hypothetical protein